MNNFGKHINSTRFAKGSIPWNKGLKGIHLSPSSEFKKGGPVNEKHPGWKGDKVSYAGIHKWLSRKLGQPKNCVDCGDSSAKKYEWANISKLYKRDFADWKRLCTGCHRKFDGHGYTMWKTRKQQI